MKKRIEIDSLGRMQIPEDVYYGIQTARAMENFPVTGKGESIELIKAYVLVKKVAALTNMELGSLDEERGAAIIKAADEILEGKLLDQFPVDIFQAGAGTSFNMNVNEVVANRALEILGKERGDYEYLSPNDHVNRSQSSNDTFPTASHIAIVMEADTLIEIITDLSRSLNTKGNELVSIPKSGHTHLMDAMPVDLGDMFTAYASALRRSGKKLLEDRNNLLEIAIGGTATGTGINTPRGYRETVVRKLSEITSIHFVQAEDSFEALQSRSQMAAFSGSLRELALELIRIANDLRLMGSGPTSGFAEINLPPVQPGSSIMPGKVNPVMAECLNMVAFQIIGNDTTVAMAAQAGQLDLNVMTPVMTSNILESISLLKNYLPVFQYRCIEGVGADEKKLRKIAGMNPSLATILSPKIGYLKAAEVVKESMEKKKSIEELVVENGLLTVQEAEELFDLEKISKNRYRK